jgi:hypothetical protein
MPDEMIGRGAPFAWPPRSPDLIQLWMLYDDLVWLSYYDASNVTCNKPSLYHLEENLTRTVAVSVQVQVSLVELGLHNNP